MISVILVEDHEVVRQSLREMLEKQEDLEVMRETGDGHEAVELTSALEPDVLLVDLTIPGLHGLGVIRQVRYQAPRTSILVLSMHNRKMYVISAIGNGADGYILKDDPYECVLEAIYSERSVRPYLSPHVEISKEELRERIRSESALSPTDYVLTPREKEVLSHIGAGSTITQVADKLSLSPRTIEVHSRNIRTKLNLENSHQMIRWAIEHGLVPGEEL